MVLRQRGFTNFCERLGRGDGLGVDPEMNDGGMARFFGGLNCGRKICVFLDRKAEAAEAPGLGAKFRLPQRRGRDAARIVALLVHPDRAVRPLSAMMTMIGASNWTAVA